MALTDRIAALTLAIANAFNARVQSPASGYDIAKLNGYTGTQAQWLADFSDPGNTDYATQFNSQLGALTYTGAATEGQAGVTQFATQTEVTTALSATKAISALQLGSVVRVFPTLTAMVAGISTVQDGGIASVGSYVLSGSFSHERSTWVKSNGKWTILPGSVLLIAGPTIIGDAQTTAGFISTFFGNNTSTMYLHPGVIARTSSATNTSTQPIELTFTGAGWIPWNALTVQAGYGSYQNSATQITTSTLEMNVTNGMATFNFNAYRAAGMGLDTSYWLMVPGWRPTKPVHTAGYSSYQGGSRTAVGVRMDADGNIYLSGNNSLSIDGFHATFQYRLAN